MGYPGVARTTLREESEKARPCDSPGVTVSRSPAPRKRARLAGLVGALLLVIGEAASAVAIPSLILDRDQSPPGTAVAWTASGFDGCLPIDDVQTDGTLVLMWDGDQELGREELANGSAVGTFDVPESAQLTEHRVTAQCVSDAALSDTWNLVVTAPREPDVAVPDVVGLTRADAEREVRAAKLVPGVVTGTGDIVEDQEPASGWLVQPQSSGRPRPRFRHPATRRRCRSRRGRPATGLSAGRAGVGRPGARQRRQPRRRQRAGAAASGGAASCAQRLGRGHPGPAPDDQGARAGPPRPDAR